LKPATFEFKANLQKKFVHATYEDMEHVRRLNAMTKRITNIGKVSFKVNFWTSIEKKM